MEGGVKFQEQQRWCWLGGVVRHALEVGHAATKLARGRCDHACTIRVWTGEKELRQKGHNIGLDGEVGTGRSTIL
jgi:hypothetical protein